MEYSRLRSLEEFDSAFYAGYGQQAQDCLPFMPLPGAPQSADRVVFAGLTGGQLQKICAWVSYIVMAVMLVGVLLFVAPKMFGVKYLEIESGSMRPRYEVGDLVVAVPAKFENIKKGDDVSYTIAENQAVTHRVIDIYENREELIVQGIHDSEFVEVVEMENVLGVVRFSAPKMGRWINIGWVRWGTIFGLLALSLLAGYIGNALGKGGQPPKKKRRAY